MSENVRFMNVNKQIYILHMGNLEARKTYFQWHFKYTWIKCGKHQLLIEVSQWNNDLWCGARQCYTLKADLCVRFLLHYRSIKLLKM